MVTRARGGAERVNIRPRRAGSSQYAARRHRQPPIASPSIPTTDVFSFLDTSVAANNNFRYREAGLLDHFHSLHDLPGTGRTAGDREYVQVRTRPRPPANRRGRQLSLPITVNAATVGTGGHNRYAMRAVRYRRTAGFSTVRLFAAGSCPIT